MNRKILILLLVLLIIVIIIAGFTLSQNKESLNTLSDSFKETSEMNNNLNSNQTGWTQSVPNNYLQEAQQKGNVERLDYQSQDFVRDGTPITKTAYVYTPYNYDENNKYNILYLMHGWGGQAGEFFQFREVKNLFDNLIQNGDIPPMIIVSPSFYNSNSGTDFKSSEEEFREFHNDFRNYLMPTVEAKYSTYAKSTSDSDLKESRDHRAFGGFSLGSVTTWLEFCYDSDYIHYFLPMSGASWYYGTFGDFQTEKNVDFIEQLVKENNLDERGYYIYHTTGTQDAVKNQTLMQAQEMLSRNQVFTPEHYNFYQKNNGYHDFNAVIEYLYNGLPKFFTSEENPKTEQTFTTNTPISDVINDPDFENYGRLIFPVNSGYYSGNTLGDLNYVWYSNMDPNKTVEITNYMKDKVQDGETIFYDIYSDEEKAADKSKENTGLFFFKGNPNEKFAVVNAGGGFAYVGAMQDSFPQALELSKLGYNAFALIYRPGWDTAFEDLARAISFIFEHKDELEINTDNYSLWGGSAGARMAATLGSYGPGAFGGANLPRPGTVITQYSGYSNYSPTDPPTYANVGTYDGIANWRIMQNRLAKLSSLGIPTEFHVYPGLSHGFGLGTSTQAEGWINEAVAFWENQRKS